MLPRSRRERPTTTEAAPIGVPEPCRSGAWSSERLGGKDSNRDYLIQRTAGPSVSVGYRSSRRMVAPFREARFGMLTPIEFEIEQHQHHKPGA